MNLKAVLQPLGRSGSKTILRYQCVRGLFIHNDILRNCISPFETVNDRNETKIKDRNGLR